MPVEPDISKFLPQDHETLAVSSNSIGLTAAKAGAAFLAEIVVEGDEIRFWKDGSAPTTAQGFLKGVGETFYLWSSELSNFRVIRVTGDATLQVQYYVRQPGLRAEQYERG